MQSALPPLCPDTPVLPPVCNTLHPLKHTHTHTHTHTPAPQVDNQRYGMYGVFLIVPVGLVRGLASKSVSVEADNSDGEEENGDEQVGAGRGRGRGRGTGARRGESGIAHDD